MKFYLYSAAFFILVFAGVFAFLSYQRTTYEVHSAAQLQLQGTALPPVLHVEHINRPALRLANAKEYTAPVDAYPVHTLSYHFFTRQYHSYLGKDARPGDKHPTIILLHDSERTGASLVDMWKETADENGLLLLAPDSADRKGWNKWRDPLGFLNSVIDDADDHSGVDRDQIYLFGHSAGGRHATSFATNQSLPFRALATHAGFNDAKTLGLSSTSGYKVPVSLYLGSKDDIFNVDVAKHTAKEFHAAGHNAELFVIDDHNHWYYSIGPELNKQIWANISQK